MINKFEQKIPRGFTLIELLVVVAIIGILASVILASLNSARTKGKEAAIKSDLKSMIPQAELFYDAPGNYSTTCAGLAGMMAAVTSAGGASGCYSYNNPAVADVYTRWGVSAKNSDGTANWSVDENGVVTWDTVNTGSTLGWDAANTACGNAGGRLPSFEELRALFTAYGVTPTGFTASTYWSGTAVPSNSANAYYVQMTNGFADYTGKTNTHRVRCVHP